MTQQPSWSRFAIHLAEFIALAAALAALQFVRTGPLEASPFFWQGLAILAAGVALVSGLGHAALGMAKARSTDPDKYKNFGSLMADYPF
ncbi:hypothetical protein LWF15_00165 [Kineosporia rhizophila]|uniref:hypothetical protein n=1 Tax=Kineosporia rhizophila TaxID=84633 RepID=UPI000B0DD051|nr:hypothetical protein [Kineosporia rhizophila]MCE0533918.1 hypothetical protein [Kineosporia rhizophila]